MEISRQNWPFKIGLSLFEFKQLLVDSGTIVHCTTFFFKRKCFEKQTTKKEYQLFWILGHNPTWWQSEIGAITLPPCTLLRKKSNEIEENVTLIKVLSNLKLNYVKMLVLKFGQISEADYRDMLSHLKSSEINLFILRPNFITFMRKKRNKL